MSKTGQIDNDGFVTVTRKKGSEAYTLYVTYTEDGPIYDTVCIDAEHDEFEVNFDDACASISTVKLKYLMLLPEQLRRLADLAEEAEEHFETWTRSTMGKDFSTAMEEGGLGQYSHKYKEVMNIRSEA